MNDLLAPESARLQIHESREAGVHVAGLREEIVTSAEQVLALLEQGEAARHVGETRMNKASSRSHSIFRMVRAPRLVCVGFLGPQGCGDTGRSRHICATRMNKASTRLHSAIFRIVRATSSVDRTFQGFDWNANA